MSGRKLAWIAVGAALGIVAVPWIIPTGPDTGLDAAQLLASGQFLLGAGVVFLGGLLTAMTPCVYPLIPITVSVFGARNAQSRGRAIVLTSAYILGLAAVFTVLGIAAAKSGQAFGSVLGHPGVVIGLAVFLLVLASSMFGAFDLNLPQSWTQRLSQVGGAGLGGAFLMGSVAGFLAAPCTGPVLTGLLAFVAKSQSTAIGGGLLFIYALGIGVPFFLIGAFAMKLPKSGPWMESVKSVLGVMLVALAATYLKDAFPAAREAVSGLAKELGRHPGTVIAGLLAAAGVLAGAVHRSFKEGTTSTVWKSFGVILIVVAVLLRGGAMDVRGPGELWIRAGLADPAAAPEFVWDIKWPSTELGAELATFDAVLARAKAEGKPVLIDFFAEWCAACKELDRHTYPAPQVISETDRFVRVKVDATNEEDAILVLYERFQVQGLPTVAFISSEGELLARPKITGFLGADRFLGELRKVR